MKKHQQVPLFGLLILLAFSLFTGCAGSADSTNTSKDQAELNILVTNLLNWVENESEIYDFPIVPNENETMFVAINQEVHAQRITELQNAGLFAEEFIENYQEIAQKIDEGLKSGGIVYRLGEAPPYGADADPWCNCQDVPEGNYWEAVQISINEISENRAIFSWTWGDPTWSEGFDYEVIAIKTEDGWKIADLMGFREYI